MLRITIELDSAAELLFYCCFVAAVVVNDVDVIRVLLLLFFKLTIVAQAM